MAHRKKELATEKNSVGPIKQILGTLLGTVKTIINLTNTYQCMCIIAYMCVYLVTVYRLCMSVLSYSDELIYHFEMKLLSSNIWNIEA